MNKEKTVKETLDLLLANATEEEHFTTIRNSVDDFIEEGYNVRRYVGEYNSKYQEFLRNKEIREWKSI